MAYNGDRLSLILSTVEGQGPSFWNYISADSLATVKGSGYFSDFLKRGGRLGDVILVSIGTLNTAVYPSSGSATADVGEASDFTTQPQTEWVQISSVSTVAFSATALGLAADLGSNVVVGDTSASTVGFWGATPVAQQAGTNQAVISSTAVSAPSGTASTSTTPYGYTTSTQANVLVQAVLSLTNLVNSMTVWQNQIRSDLVTIGIQKGSA